MIQSFLKVSLWTLKKNNLIIIVDRNAGLLRSQYQALFNFNRKKTGPVKQQFVIKNEVIHIGFYYKQH